METAPLIAALGEQIKSPMIPLAEETAISSEPQLPRFSHTPPRNITGRRRWPFSLDHQAFPPTATPVLQDVLIWVYPYLECNDQRGVTCIAKQYKRGPEYGPLWFTRLWLPNRRIRW